MWHRTLEGAQALTTSDCCLDRRISVQRCTPPPHVRHSTDFEADPWASSMLTRMTSSLGKPCRFVGNVLGGVSCGPLRHPPSHPLRPGAAQQQRTEGKELLPCFSLSLSPSLFLFLISQSTKSISVVNYIHERVKAKLFLFCFFSSPA